MLDRIWLRVPCGCGVVSGQRSGEHRSWTGLMDWIESGMSIPVESV